MGHVVAPAGVPDRGPGLMAFSIVLLVLTTLMTLIRVVSRIITRQRWWWDDSVAVLSWVGDFKRTVVLPWSKI